MNEIIRYEYLSELELLKNKHFIKVLTGIRRSGKSTILNQFKKILIKKYNVPINNIQIYDFNDKRLLTHN
jgi:predicted AAA+ superfamily ATPase